MSVIIKESPTMRLTLVSLHQPLACSRDIKLYPINPSLIINQVAWSVPKPVFEAQFGVLITRKSCCRHTESDPEPPARQGQCSVALSAPEIKQQPIVCQAYQLQDEHGNIQTLHVNLFLPATLTVVGLCVVISNPVVLMCCRILRQVRHIPLLHLACNLCCFDVHCIACSL